MKKNRCKYCGAIIGAYYKTCSTCGYKLKLVRKLLAMVKKAKREVEQQ